MFTAQEVLTILLSIAIGISGYIAMELRMLRRTVSGLTEQLRLMDTKHQLLAQRVEILVGKE